jgi:hypothetical protein
MDKNKVLNQDLNIEANFSGVYNITLLFQKKIEPLAYNVLFDKLKEKFGDVDVVSKSELSSFALKEHCVEYKEGKRFPSQLLITECNPVNEPLGDDIARTQFWDCPNGVELLDSCPWQVMISDFMAGGLPTFERASVLSDWLEVALELFPTCTAVYFNLSGKLLTASDAKNNPYSGHCRFVHGGINARFFNIHGSNNMIVDTLGLYALGMPDVQYHFHSLDPNVIVRHAYNTAIYQYENNVPIESGNTIEGIEEENKWKCHYERSLIQPVRDVLDVVTGDYAAGNRN